MKENKVLNGNQQLEKEFEHLDDATKKIISLLVNVVQRDPELTALCPFHKEETPSFLINLEKCEFYCSVCNELGTIRQLSLILGIKPGQFIPSYLTDKKKKLYSWLKKKNFENAIYTLTDLLKNAYRHKRNEIEKKWTEGLLLEVEYYTQRRKLNYEFGCNLECREIPIDG